MPAGIYIVQVVFLGVCYKRTTMPGGAHENMKAWAPEEDHIILEMHEHEGPKWSKIVQRLPGRTISSVRNRWQRIEKGRKLREQGKESKNKCHSCGQLKRGHVCYAKMRGGPMVEYHNTSPTMMPGSRVYIDSDGKVEKMPTPLLLQLQQPCLGDGIISVQPPFRQTRISEHGRIDGSDRETKDGLLDDTDLTCDIAVNHRSVLPLVTARSNSSFFNDLVCCGSSHKGLGCNVWLPLLYPLLQQRTLKYLMSASERKRAPHHSSCTPPAQ